jgi:prepilin-type N-terminal cleavage/methylation domain-containing protein
MIRHGMTLLEMLLALALLSAIVAATASWTQIAAGLVSTDGPVQRQHWIGASNSLFDLIDQDLRSGDFEENKSANPKTKPNPQVVADANHLTIRTRVAGHGAVIHEYRLNEISGVLELIEHFGTATQPRTLLDQVRSWNCQVDTIRTCFDATIEKVDGTIIQRRYHLP